MARPKNHSRGEAHYRSRLTEEQVRWIRSVPKMTIKEQAEKLGVTSRCIQNVRYYITWAHID